MKNRGQKMKFNYFAVLGQSKNREKNWTNFDYITAWIHVSFVSRLQISFHFAFVRTKKTAAVEHDTSAASDCIYFERGTRMTPAPIHTFIQIHSHVSRIKMTTVVVAISENDEQQKNRLSSDSQMARSSSLFQFWPQIDFQKQKTTIIRSFEFKSKVIYAFVYRWRGHCWLSDIRYTTKYVSVTNVALN